jgi:hypothetical protein
MGIQADRRLAKVISWGFSVVLLGVYSVAASVWSLGMIRKFDASLKSQ